MREASAVEAGHAPHHDRPIPLSTGPITPGPAPATARNQPIPRPFGRAGRAGGHDGNRARQRRPRGRPCRFGLCPALTAVSVVRAGAGFPADQVRWTAAGPGPAGFGLRLSGVTASGFHAS
jgi:hypothetical protein